MNTTQIAVLVGCAVGVFWAVGAYNRLSALRDDIAKSFAPVDAQVQHRHALLLKWGEAVREVLDQQPQLNEALAAACSQVLAACDGVRARPSARSAATGLQAAEEALSAARARLQTELPARQTRLTGLHIEADGEQLAAADSALAFARSQFNATTDTYNRAIRQFPTWLVAGAFGFQPAGSV